jgi:transcriptional regulator GlxA family with amidase domain
MQWVTGVRIRRAQELLETKDHGVDHIAHLVGFASSAHFRAQFKRLSGLRHTHTAPHSAHRPDYGDHLRVDLAGVADG